MYKPTNVTAQRALKDLIDTYLMEVIDPTGMTGITDEEYTEARLKAEKDMGYKG
jgi:hypothetical protein